MGSGAVLGRGGSQMITGLHNKSEKTPEYEGVMVSRKVSQRTE